MFSCCMKSDTEKSAAPSNKNQSANNGKGRSKSPEEPVKSQPKKQASPVKGSSPVKETASKEKSPPKDSVAKKRESPVKETKKDPSAVKENVIRKNLVAEVAKPPSLTPVTVSPNQVQFDISAYESLYNLFGDVKEYLESDPKDLAKLKKKTQQLKQALAEYNGPVDSIMASELSSLVNRLEAVTSKLEGLAAGGGVGAGAGGAGGVDDSVSPYVTAYDDFAAGNLADFLNASNKIGGDVKTVGEHVKSLVAAQRAFLVKASKCKQPAQDQLMMELKPMADCIQQIQSFREAKRGSEFFNHLSTLSEAVPAFGWVSMSPAPAPFAKEMADAGQFYSNRVLKDWKEKDVTHKDWVQSWNKAMGDLQAYIKQWHTTGVTWNAKGVDVSSFAASRGAAAPPPPPPAGGAPPPPPPPAIQPPTGAPPASDSSSGDGERAALFAELSKGSDITKGLKKVTDDMKTHKNPNLKLQTPRPYKASPPTAPKPFKPVAAASPVKQVAAPKKPPKFELDGKKWLVEFQDGNRNIVISDTNIKQTVYIYKCTNSTIQVQGKVNSIVVDNCKKVGVVFENVISSCEFVNCQSVQGQVTGKVPTVSIDKTDGCMMYLSAESTEAEIYSAKSSEMNILIPDASGEYKEFAVPEQYKTTWNGKALVTTTTESI